MMTSHNEFRKLKYLVLEDCQTLGCGDRRSVLSRKCIRCEIDELSEQAKNIPLRFYRGKPAGERMYCLCVHGRPMG